MAGFLSPLPPFLKVFGASAPQANPMPLCARVSARPRYSAEITVKTRYGAAATARKRFQTVATTGGCQCQ